MAVLFAGCGPRHVSYDIWPEPEETVHEQSGISVRTYPVGDFSNRLAVEVRNQRDTSITLFLSRSVLMNEDSVVQRWPGAGTTQGLLIGLSGGYTAPGKKEGVSVWKSVGVSSETITSSWDTTLIPPRAPWIDTAITFSSERHRFQEDKLDESLDSLETDLKGRNLAGISLAFQGEIITPWVHGNRIGKLKQTDEEVSQGTEGYTLCCECYLVDSHSGLAD